MNEKYIGLDNSFIQFTLTEYNGIQLLLNPRVCLKFAFQISPVVVVKNNNNMII